MPAETLMVPSMRSALVGTGRTASTAWVSTGRVDEMSTRGVAEMSTRQALQYAVIWQVVSFMLLGMQMLLVCALGPVALVFGLTGLLVLFATRPLAGATVFLQVLLYQNWFLAVFSRFGLDHAAFQAVQGLAFAAVVCLSGVAVVRMTRSGSAGATATVLMRWICIALVVMLAYTAYGVTKSSPGSAITYLRNSSAMLLALLVGLDLGRRWSYRTVAIIFLVSIVFGVVADLAELAIPVEYYQAIGAIDFWNLKNAVPDGTGPIMRSVDELVRARIVTWFNITGGTGDRLSIRSFGPNMHAVSYAYVIGVTAIVAVTLRRFEIVVLALGLLVMAGIKGPLLMLLATISLSTLWMITRNRVMVLMASVVLLVAYVGFGIRTGIAHSDFHVIGFLGGLHGFMTTPQGHGIGVGGNLSALAVGELDWAAWQKLGVDFALESAVGVLLYQMGVAVAFVYLPIFITIFGGFKHRMRNRGGIMTRPTDTLFIAIAVMLANGFFQEEAYSPYALGLLTLFGGIVISNLGSNEPTRTAVRR